MPSQSFVVRFAGEGGQGMVTSAEALAQAAATGGYHAQSSATFPSQIMGGPTWAQVRISNDPVLSPGDDLDVLVAFNKEAYDTHQGEVREGGVIVYNSGDFELEDDQMSFGMPFAELARQTGNPRAENMIVIGAFAHLIGMPMNFIEEFVVKRFTRGRAGDEEIIKANIMALELGRARAAESGFNVGSLPSPNPPDFTQLLVKGNEAIALGALTAGLDYFVGYPISPATTILLYMERNLVGEGKFAYQASSEIESINTIIGAGYAGKKAMTSTAGPGLSLMSEGIGMAWMSEIPVVIVNVQRGGPATGLPTKTEQSDFNVCLHPAHGDASIPIIAPGSVEDCFVAAIHAMNWSERYQGPVILLTEMYLAEQSKNIRKPDVDSVRIEERNVYRGENGYHRYAGDGMSPMPIPGGPGAYVANPSEHDPMGDTTHLPNRHIEMTERRFAKLKLLEDGTYDAIDPHEPVVLMPWGGSSGPALEAFLQLKEMDYPIGWRFTMFLNPLPPKLLEDLREKELVIVPELNYQGQFSAYLRAQGVKAVSITQYTGLPFKVSKLVSEIRERVESHKQETVAV